MRLILALIAALLALGIAARGEAACQTLTGTVLGFGSSSSYTVRSGGIAQSSSGAGFSCNGSLISLISTNYARATVTSGNAFRMIGPSGDAVPYTLSADPAGTYAFTQGSTLDYMNPTLLSVLGILNSGTFAPKIYGVPGAGANVAAGTYSDTLTINWQWNVCHGIGVGGVCILGESGSGTATITVTIVVSNDCRISAPAISFGSAPLVGQFAQVAQAVAVSCTKDAPFSVSFTSGDAGTARPWRRMSDGAGHVMQYNIYRPDGVTIWDEGNPLASTTNGTGALTPGILQNYIAKIDGTQITPPVGTYRDTVSVIVSF